MGLFPMVKVLTHNVPPTNNAKREAARERLYNGNYRLVELNNNRPETATTLAQMLQQMDIDILEVDESFPMEIIQELLPWLSKRKTHIIVQVMDPSMNLFQHFNLIRHISVETTKIA